MPRPLYSVTKRHGIPESWRVDPEQHTMIVFSDPCVGGFGVNTASSEVAISATIAGLSADLAPLFVSICDD